MMKTQTLAAALGGGALAAAITAMALTANAADPAGPKPGSDAFRDAVRQVLVENPDIVIDALNAFEMQQVETERQELRDAVAEHGHVLDQTPGVHYAGNPNGSILMVEFFDYHCGFCKTANPAVLDMIEENPDLKVAFIEFPILSAESQLAARAAIAAGEQDRYLDMHNALMQASGRKTKEHIMAIAKDLGIDTVRLERDMTSERTDVILDGHERFATLMRIQGTPAFLVNGEPVTGWREDVVKDLIDEARKG